MQETGIGTYADGTLLIKPLVGRSGKHLPTYTPSMDMGAYVIVINADKVTVSGKKPAAKTYFRHVTGRPGSWTIESFNELQAVGRGT